MTVSNAIFLQALAGESFKAWNDKHLWLTGFACDPNKAEARNLSGWPLNGSGAFPRPEMNAYWSIGVFRAGGRRRKVDQVGLLAIVLDDVAIDDLDTLPAAPTYVLESSPHN